MNYGIPYMGSKSKIAASIAMNFPKAENFYDLFGGGFSMTHYTMIRCKHKFKNFFYNEINSDVVDLVKKAIDGEFSYKVFKPEFVTRDEFFKRKDSDAYIRCLWSFGNSQKSYLFSKEIEPYKKSMHNAVVFDEFDDISRAVIGDNWPKKVDSIYLRRLFIRQKIEYFRKTNTLPVIITNFLNEKQLQRLQQLQQLQQLEQLEQLERLQQLEQLEQLQQLHTSSLSYEDVEIEGNSIVYCDIPYKDTASYLIDFDHDKFYDWAASRNFPVFISEYEIPDDRFKLIYQIKKRSLLQSVGVNVKIEKLYWNGK